MENKISSDILSCLKNIDESIEKIYYILPEKINFSEFQNDSNLKVIIQQHLDTIDEAMDCLLYDNPEISITDYRKIIVHRKSFPHGETEERLPEDAIWLIVNRYLPILKEEIKDFLD